MDQFWIVTDSPLACNNLANDEAIIPFPKDEVTPPVTKIYFAVLGCPLPDIVIKLKFEFF